MALSISIERFVKPQRNKPSSQLIEHSPKLANILGHTASLNIFMKIIKVDHHALKLDINNNRKLTNSWNLSNSQLNDCCVKTKIKKLKTS